MYIRFNGFQAGGWGELHVVDVPSPEDDIITSRSDVLGGDGQVAGSDYLRKTVWNITLLVNTRSYEAGSAAVRRVKNAWQDPEIRQSSTLAPLEYSRDGIEWYRVYGRPVNYGGPPQGTRLEQGIAHIELQFEQLDPLHYTSVEESLHLPVARGVSGGLRVPVAFPIRFARSGGEAGQWAENSGERPAPVQLRFNGPMSDAEVTLQGHWTFKMRGSLAWDEYLVVDPNPTEPTAYVYSTTGAGRRGAFTMIGMGSRLSDLFIPPGQHSFSFRAIDPTYTASVTASWSHTYSSMQ